MKESEVPQDQSSLQSNSIKELCYAVNDKGEYVTALSSGWNPKTMVQEATLEQINRRIEEAKDKVASGLASPIVYFMEVHRMDMTTLCGYVSMMRWRVKRHFNPAVFRKLRSSVLKRYAEAFDITIEELKAFDGKK